MLKLLRARRRSRQGEEGFTLIELMVVIVIIGLLATIVVVNVLPAQDTAMRRKAEADIALLEQAVEMYRLDMFAATPPATAVAAISSAFPMTPGAMAINMRFRDATGLSIFTAWVPMGAKAARARMPTSATGNSRVASPNGFTLVELLVVLVVIGLASAAVMLTLPDDRGGLRVEAERLAARVHAARDEAIVQAKPVALIIDSSGYGFERYRRGEWRPITEPPFDRREWPENMLVRIEGAADGRVAFDEMGISDGAIVTLNRGEDQVRIGIGSDGKIDADI